MTESNTNEDIVFEQDAEFTERDPKEALEKLRQKLKATEAQKQEYLDGWQRAKADFINTRKRDEEHHAQMVKFSNEQLISDLIPVLDSFDMATANKEAWEKAPKEWRMGVEYINSQLLSTLGQYGLTQFNPLGQEFDPKQHDAVETLETDKKEEDNKVLVVLQKGYSLNGKLIRSAKVKTGVYNA